MHGLWSIWTTLWCTALSVQCPSHGSLELSYAGDSRAFLNAEFNTQAHTGRGEKVTGRIWEGSVWASLTLMNREGLNSFQLGLVLHWEWMFLLSSRGLHNPFPTCFSPFETKAIRHLTKQTLFSFGVRVHFYFSKSVGFNPISCLGKGENR